MSDSSLPSVLSLQFFTPSKLTLEKVKLSHPLYELLVTARSYSPPGSLPPHRASAPRSAQVTHQQLKSGHVSEKAC